MSKLETENGHLQKQTNNNSRIINNNGSSNTNINNIIKINTEPSSFIPFEEILAIDLNNDETIAEIFAELYAQDGEVDNILQIMSFHTKFLKDFLNFYNYLMYSQGVLAYDLRHYLAIIAASRHKCFYLIKQQEKEFKQHNGNSDWLKGIDNIPQKLKDLYEINKILAHQPWLINHEHITKTLRGQFSWSVTELIMAITILIHFHALSGFVFGCGINDKYMQLIQQIKDLNNIDIDNNNNNTTTKEIDIIQNQNNNNNNNSNNFLHASNSPVLSEINFLLREMQMIKNEELSKKEETKENNPILNNNRNNSNNKYSSNSQACVINANGSGASTNHYSTTNFASSKTFESTANAAAATASATASSITSMNTMDAVNNYILKYIYDPDYTHQDFRNADQALRLEYYTWEHHGYITGCSLYPEISNLLDQTFKTAYNMTYNTLGNYKSVDTGLFRRAVWIYIHSIFGIRYDDYDYSQIKQLLTLPLRNFIKTVCIYPERITKKDYDSIMKELSHAEKFFFKQEKAATLTGLKSIVYNIAAASMIMDHKAKLKRKQQPAIK